eukprot:TRINITY_DN633_c2_g1_i1.p1 TRINITY_DN633_c2_g1~~TRINITY_DN633_c2_g1_i1.p1  ORF type:complete len:618 (+),score=103.09 TRINITY_DN633_c2_g1_i1:736-2589(+)
MGRGSLSRQARHWTPGVHFSWQGNHVEHMDLKKQVLGLYRDCLQSIPVVKSNYSLSMPKSTMAKRIRLAFELNRNVQEPWAIYKLLHQGRSDYQHSVSHLFTSDIYLLNKYFSSQGPVMLKAAANAWQSREIIYSRKLSRDKARAIATGESEFTALPGPIYNDEGELTGYYHPKGDLPTGESHLFARPPEYKDWGEYSLPDPWNPHDNPQGPPDPHLIQNSEQVYKVDLARMGPYNRHRLRRLIEHEKKTRTMSEYEYLMYFKENEVHMLANDFELPEYEWAEDRFERRMAKVKNENQLIFASARADWVEKYKAHWKAVNYAPAIDYWLLSFKQWIPNYNKEVVAFAENPEDLDDTWDEFVSTPAHYAAWRSAAFSGVMTNAAQTPLAVTYETFLRSVDPSDPTTACRPYDHPQFEDKWYTDNGAFALTFPKQDLEDGFGVPHHGISVLAAQMSQLKDEIGCVELTEQRYKGEWWNRGHIRLMTAMAKIHEMELITALCKACGATAADSQEAAEKKFAQHKWDNFSFTEFSYLRYPDHDVKGVHAWRVSENDSQREAEENLLEKFSSSFKTIFSHEQTVPVWYRGCSKRARLNKPAEEGGWSLKEDKVKFWDQLASF